MGRAPCCDKTKVKKGPWSPEEDATLKNFLEKYGTGGNWIALPHKAGLKRCGKSCRLRWLNYLRPNIKHGGFTEEEDNIICTLHSKLGSRWSIIASHLPGRTDNDVKNHWNTKIKKKLMAAKSNVPTTVGDGVRTPSVAASAPNPELYAAPPTFSALLSRGFPPVPSPTDAAYGLSCINPPNFMPDPAPYPLPELIDGCESDESANRGISDSASFVAEDHYLAWLGNPSGGGDSGFSVGFSAGFSHEIIGSGSSGGGIWCQDPVGEFGGSYQNLVNNSFYAETKPQGLYQTVANQY